MQNLSILFAILSINAEFYVLRAEIYCKLEGGQEGESEKERGESDGEKVMRERGER